MTGEATYSLRRLQQMLGLSRRVLTGLIEAGFVTPTRGARNEYRFGFQDVVLLRTAHALQSASIPPRRIVQSLKRLKAALPDELPLSGLRIAAVGNDIVVREGESQWAADSGQMLLDFEVRPAGGDVAVLPHVVALAAPERARQSAAGEDAESWFSRGEALEADDLCAAESAYREALRIAPGHVGAALNLGVLVCEAGRGDEALRVYAEALEHHPDEPLLYFNLAVTLEDQGDPQRALAAYDRALQLAPDLADAHYNAARLHEELGDRQKALRHYSAYRRLEKKK